MCLILWVCLVFYTKLHEDSAQVLITEIGRSDWHRNYMADPSQDFLTQIRSSSLPLLFSLWRIKVNPTLLPQLHSLCQSSPGSTAGGVFCAVPQALKDLRSHGTIIHESMEAVKLWTVPPLSKHVFCKKIKLFMKRCDVLNKTMLTCNWIMHSVVAFS